MGYSTIEIERLLNDAAKGKDVTEAAKKILGTRRKFKKGDVVWTMDLGTIRRGRIMDDKVYSGKVVYDIHFYGDYRYNAMIIEDFIFPTETALIDHYYEFFKSRRGE